MIRDHWAYEDEWQDEDDESDRDRTSANMTHAPQRAPGAGLEGLSGTRARPDDSRPAEATQEETR